MKDLASRAMRTGPQGGFPEPVYGDAPATIRPSRGRPRLPVRPGSDPSLPAGLARTAARRAGGSPEAAEERVGGAPPPPGAHLATKTWVQYGVPPELLTMPAPMRLYLQFMMFLRWPSLFIQPATTEAGVP